MRTPSSTLVVDTTILIAAARGRSSGALIAAAGLRDLVTTDRVVSEAHRLIEFGLKRPELVSVVDALCALMTIAPVHSFSPGTLSLCETALRDAVPSRNGSTRDAHVLGLAWTVNGDVWTNDRDFAGTGVASWSTSNLMRALGQAKSEVAEDT